VKEFVVAKSEERQRFSKYLQRVLKEANSSFIYKMLRKKNITLNDLKADGTEMLVEGDVVKLFLSDETFEKFAGEFGSSSSEDTLPRFSVNPVKKTSIPYEDEHLLLCYKPAGILSQKDTKEGDSINEQILQYLVESGSITKESLRMFKPGICNRLDRNTSGLVLFAKSLIGQQLISEALKSRTLQKYYLAIVIGEMKGTFEHKGYLVKDEQSNKVSICAEPCEQAERIHTKGRVLASNDRVSLLEIDLVTGKSHQIRSVMEHLGHPVLGDPKYLGKNASEISELKAHYGIKYQLLLCYRYDFPNMKQPLQKLSGKKIYAPIPKSLANVVKEEFPDFHLSREK